MGGVGDELADLLLAAVPGLERGLHVGEQRVQRGADLAHLGPLVGQALRHPLRQLDVALGQRQRRHGVRGRGDLGERPELATYDEHAGRRGEHPAEQDRGPTSHHHQGRHGFVDVRGREPGGELAVLVLDDGDPVAAEAGDLDLAHLSVGGQSVDDGQRAGC